ncbi:hypothetical protein [Clostridium estertheticum]|uniref:hypothetical protein n=1 Tax=Clostridium estertheticum TaxID=238834 RepID=UPI001C0B180C|nr:hypothetical protein [Clostridium estertheticum]MBU3185681.1 hypothetical protein [Clostridium estertheticum]
MDKKELLKKLKLKINSMTGEEFATHLMNNGVNVLGYSSGLEGIISNVCYDSLNASIKLDGTIKTTNSLKTFDFENSNFDFNYENLGLAQ